VTVSERKRGKFANGEGAVVKHYNPAGKRKLRKKGGRKKAIKKE